MLGRFQTPRKIAPNTNPGGAAPLNRLSGFNDNGIVLTDRQGTKRVAVSDADEKAYGVGSDPLAIYRALL
jgi:hypothetical protein